MDLTLGVGCGGDSYYIYTTQDFRNTAVAGVNVDLRLLITRLLNFVQAVVQHQDPFEMQEERFQRIAELIS